MADGVAAADPISTETAPIQHEGDCFGVLCSFDITDHTDPNVIVEIEAMLSVDGGLIWTYGGGMSRAGGKIPHPVTGEPLTTAGFRTTNPEYQYDAKGKFLGAVGKWQSPLIKLVKRVKGGDLAAMPSGVGVSVFAVPSDVPDQHHSIAVVQTAGAQGWGATTITTAGITTTNANLVIADVVHLSSYAAFTSIMDSNTNTWSAGIAAFTNSSGQKAQGIEKYNSNITGGSGHTFTLTLGSAGYGAIAITEVSGADATPLDKTATTIDDVGHNTTHTCTATATTAQAAELWHGFGADNVDNAFHVFSVSSPWTQGVSLADVAAVGLGIITGDQVVGSTGAAAFVYSDTGASNDNFLIGTSTWKEAAGGGGSPSGVHSHFHYYKAAA